MLGAQFFGSLPIGVLLVFFPLYLHDLGMRSLAIGGMFTVAGIGSSLLLLAIGPAADRFGRRRFLIAGMGTPMVAFSLFTISTSTPSLIIASALGGVGFSGGFGGGLVTATFNPLLAGTVPPRLRTTAMAWSEAAWVLSIGLGALLAGVPTLLVHAGIATALAADRALFVCCFVCTAVATALLLPVREGGSHTDAHPVRPAEGRTPLRRAAPLILKLSVFFTLQGAGLGLVVQLLPLWFTLRFHSTAASIAPWFAAAQIAGLPLIFLVPPLARRLGVAAVILLVSTSSTVALLGVPMAGALWLAGGLFVVRSAIVSMQWPAQHSFLQGAIDPRLRGTATSIAMGCWSVANALLPSLAGYLLDRGLVEWPLMLGAACYALAVIWFWAALRSTPLPEEDDAALPLPLPLPLAAAMAD